MRAGENLEHLTAGGYFQSRTHARAGFLTVSVLSANVHRRHLTKGQQAMAVALAYPNSEQGKRLTSLKIKEVGLNSGYISQARFVLRHCRDKANCG